MITDFILKIKEKKLIQRYGFLVLAQFIGAISYNLLFYPSKIVAGGANGLSILVESIFHIPPYLFLLVFYVIILIIAVVTIGMEKTSGAVVATFIYPLFVDLTSGLTSIIDINKNDILLICLFAGLLSGLANGITYKNGFSSGGLSLISQIIYEKFKISISKVNYVINIVISLLGALYFGIENIVYSVIILFIMRIVIDKVLLGISNNKVFYIITSKQEEVKKYIKNELGHGITEFDVISGYENKNSQVLMTVIPTREYVKFKEMIQKIDKNSFFVITDSYQMLNGS